MTAHFVLFLHRFCSNLHLCHMRLLSYLFLISHILSPFSSSLHPYSMLAILTLWFGISVPLVFLGAFYGYKKDPIEFPVVTSNIPRQIPTQPWYLHPILTCLLGNIYRGRKIFPIKKNLSVDPNFLITFDHTKLY